MLLSQGRNGGAGALSLSSDQIFIGAGAAGRGKGFPWGNPELAAPRTPSLPARPVGAPVIKRRGKDKL